jgi:hypothetical protein
MLNNPSAGPDSPLGFQEVEDPRIFRQSAHEGGKAASNTSKYPQYSFILEAESTSGPRERTEGFNQ